MIVSHRPANPVGWLFCFAGLLFIVPSLGTAFADYSLYELHGQLPDTLLMATVSDKSEILLLGLLLVFGWSLCCWRWCTLMAAYYRVGGGSWLGEP